MDISIEGCNLQSGTVGIKVKILHPDVKLPDKIILKEEKKHETTQQAQTTEQPRKEQ